MNWRPWTRTPPPLGYTTGADWVARMRSGALDRHERAELREWLSRSPDHARDLLRAETTWRLSGAMISDEAVRRELEEIEQETSPPSIEQAAEHAPSRSQPAYSRRVNGWRAAAASFAVACVAAVGLWLHFGTGNAYETAHGEQRVVTLADGSVVALNTNTQLRVALSENARDVYLRRGEALFQVAHDPQRPFVVHAGRGYARAVGTRFNVLAAGDRITVSVLEGRVEVSPVDGTTALERKHAQPETSNGEAASSPVPSPTPSSAHATGSASDHRTLLHAGQSAAYGQSGSLLPPRPLQASTERIIAWREGKLRFDTWRLADAIDEYNRYTNKPIRLATPALADVQITGVFRIGDSNAFVTALGELVDAKVEDTGEVLVLRGCESLTCR